MTDAAAHTPPRPFQALGRALLLHCPNCGSGGILKSWFALEDRCPRCNLQLGRSEADYFLGAYLVSLAVVEVIFAIAFLVVLLVTWPNPPWDLIQWGGAFLMLAAVIFVYPFAKTLWLAADLIFRPVNEAELRTDGLAPPGEDDSR